jgi:ABC-type nitrate/sulfonate/bicarbonate transport system substrate-binding protein
MTAMLRHAARLLGFAPAVLALVVASLAGLAQAEPVKFRVGCGLAAEDQLWLLLVRPDLAPHHGKSYTTEFTRFPGADKRFQAFEAGALDVAAVSANGVLFAAGEGVELKIIASLTRESPRGFFTQFLARDDSPIKSIKDLKGKTLGINGFSGSGHLWTKAALEQAGIAEDEVTLVPLPFPAQGEALKANKIDVGMFPQPFYAMAEKAGGTRTIFTSKTGMPYEEELIVLIAKPEFLERNRAAVMDFLSDLVVVTKYYVEHQREAKTALIDAKMVRLDPDIYIGMKEYYRDPGVRIDPQALERMQDGQVRAGFQKSRADLSKYIDLSYLPK